VEFRKLVKNKGFTLLELLIVIGILAISATVVTLVLHPAEQISQANDSRRLSELGTIDKALQIAESQGISYLGSPNIVYVSLPSNNSDCSGLGLPSLSGGWIYHCSTQANYRKVNGSGWIPVNFSSLVTGAPFGVLPIDPVNTPESGFYYTYVVSGNGWEDTAILETTRYQQQYAAKDAGQSNIAEEVGSKHKITPYEVVTRSTGGSLFAISLATNPVSAGSITFDGTTYSNGENINKSAGSYVIIANSGSGYTFSSWATTGGLTVTNPSSANTSVTVDNTGSLQMNQATSGFTVTFATNPVAGSITFDGSSYTNGQTTGASAGTYNITANPGSGNTFTSWTTTGSLSVANPSSANTTVTVSGAGTLQMNQATSGFTVTFATDPTTTGSITFNSNSYTNGQTASISSGTYDISANAGSGYVFGSWTATGGLTVTSPSSANTTVTVSGAGTLQMNQATSGFTVTFATNPVAGSITFDGSSYTNGQTTSKSSGTYNISAVSSSGYIFSSWTTTGSLSVANPSSANTTATVSGAGTLQMNQNKLIVYDFESGEQGWTHGIYSGTKDWLRTNAFTGSCALSLGTYAMVDQQCSVLVNDWLRSPIIDLTGSTAANLTLKVWQSDENGGCYIGGSWDRKDLRVCRDDGAGGVTNCTSLACSWTNNATWNSYNYNISSYAGFNNVVLMFRYNTGDSCCGEKGWAVDDIKITY